MSSTLRVYVVQVNVMSELLKLWEFRGDLSIGEFLHQACGETMATMSNDAVLARARAFVDGTSARTNPLRKRPDLDEGGSDPLG